MNDQEVLLLKAIEKSKESLGKGLFPAGAVVVIDNNQIMSEEISDWYPNPKHADLKAIDSAFETLKVSLENCILYCSLEPCLMCLSKAYWAGIKKIVFACKKESVSHLYYESSQPNKEITSHFNTPIELVHVSSLEGEAKSVIKAWEEKK
jgi:guanine deaminase